MEIACISFKNAAPSMRICLEKKQAPILGPKLRALKHVGFAGIENTRADKQYTYIEKKPTPTEKRNHPPDTSK
jgi:hypothetical protein